LIFLAFNFFYATFPIYSAAVLEWDPQQLGFFFTILSGVMILVQGPLLSFLGDKISDRMLFFLGNVISGIAFFLFTQEQLLELYLGAVLFGIGNGIMWPSYMSRLASTGPQNLQGGIQGYATSLGSAASIIGLVTGGMLFTVLQGKIFLITAILLTLTGLTAFFWRAESGD
jgi:predicted MFS family arabinose efflux permease